MRSHLATVFIVACGAGTACRADSPRGIIEKAIEAQGGEAKVAKLRGMRIKAEGTMTLDPAQPAVALTIEDTWQMPDRYKTVSRFKFMGMDVTQTQVIDGDKGWVSANGQTQDMPKDAVTEMKEQKYAEDLDRLGFLKEKGYDLSALDEIKVSDKPAVGVLVKSKGHRDVKLYFDKSTHLLVKREHRVLGGEGKEVLQEVLFGDYREKDGVKHWHTIALLRDGKKMAEAKVTELEFLDKIDAKVFAKP